MHHKRHRIASPTRVLQISGLAGCLVLILGLLAQWAANGGFHLERLIGVGVISAAVFVFSLRWQCVIRQRELDMMRRLELILRMNDRVRNAVQAIEYLHFMVNPEVQKLVRESVDVIDLELRAVLAEHGQTQGREGQWVANGQ